MTPSHEHKHKGSILIIGDESASLELLFTLLTEDGYAVHERQPELGSHLRAVKDTLPDLVLVDVRMSDIDGYGVCAGLKTDPTTRTIPVIFISSIERSINQAKALVSGAVDYVTDPFDAEEVLWRIETHITLRRLRENLKATAGNQGRRPVAPDADLETAFRDIHVLTQVTGRKHAEEKVRQAERELKRSKAFLAEGQRLSLTGNFSWKVGTDEITWSDELYRIYEFEVGVPVTLNLIRTRIHPEDVSLIEKMKMLDQAGAVSTHFEWQWRLMMPDHSIKHLHAVAHATQDQHGQLEFIGAVQDVTERKIAEEALNRARAELAHMARLTTMSALTASIAHEINQPLAAAVTSAGACLRWLDRDQPDVQRAREAALRIEEDGKRASEIITHVKSLYKKDVSPQREPVSVNDLVGEMLLLLRGEADRHSVEMRTDLAADLPSVSADRVQLQQVLMNLMLNGMEAMNAPTGALTISTRGRDETVLVSVSDTGVGIPADKLDDIFSAFVTTKAGGTGMGLAISRTIIEAHGGRLWATANPEAGATLHFTLPTHPMPQ